MERLTGLIGILLLIGTAYGLSNNRKRISMNIVGWGLGLQIIFAFIILKTPIGRPFFTILDKIIKNLTRQKFWSVDKIVIILKTTVLLQGLLVLKC